MSKFEELKPCPFCNCQLLDWHTNGELVLIEHPNNDCILADYREGENTGVCLDVERWNTRPLEDAANREGMERASDIASDNCNMPFECNCFTKIEAAICKEVE